MDRFVILTGLSGAGKMTGLHALEDLGFFTADNVPPSLWQDLLKQAKDAGLYQIVVGIDIRTRAFLGELEPTLIDLRSKDIQPEIIFLDAADEVLVKRYNLTRRTHPLGQAPLSNDIAHEREVLSVLRAHADAVFDTSRTSTKEFVDALRQRFGAEQGFRLRLLSFGFKRGVPIDADTVLDLRALPNPYYDPDLRPIDGRDERVQAYVFTPAALEFYSKLCAFVREVTLMAQSAGRSSYTVAVGCTGGQHRSVAVAERLGHDLADSFSPYLEHRDVALALQEHAQQAQA